MDSTKRYRAIGLMSGTSADGIDIALIESDGYKYLSPGGWATSPYTKNFREQLKMLTPGSNNLPEIEQKLTLLHLATIIDFISREKLKLEEIDLVGFHGHTIDHNPKQSRSVQIGDGFLLAERLKIPVINDFRSNDVLHGGQGAPLTPIFHSILVENLKKPVVILNIGGVANVTWIGNGENNIMAFDVGPGNAMIDDWMLVNDAGNFDVDGRTAARGTPNFSTVREFLSNNYFETRPPKSLDRDQFSLSLLHKFSLEDGAATLNAFTIESIWLSQEYFPKPVSYWIVCGGGRHNRHMMSQLRNRLYQPVLSAEDLGWQGDAIEAQAFAYLAVRSRLGLPISFPATTGVKIPTKGGVLYSPKDVSKAY